MLTFLKPFVNLVLYIFAVCANSKFNSFVQQTSFPSSYCKINLGESLSVNCFVNFSTSQSVSLGSTVQTTEQWNS